MAWSIDSPSGEGGRVGWRRARSALVGLALVCLGLALGADALRAQDSAVARTAPPSGPAGGAPSAVGPLGTLGTVVYELVPAESDDVHAAIERTIAPLNFIIRPIARHRLARTNHTPAHLTIEIRPETRVVTFEGANPIPTPRDGSSLPWISGVSKELYHVHAAVAGDTLVQTILASDGRRVDEFVLTPDGARVHLHVTLYAERLPTPLSYSLTFRRSP